MFRLLALLLIALALGLCGPQPSEAAGAPIPAFVSPEPQITPDCDPGTDDLNTTNARTTVVALGADRAYTAAVTQPSSVVAPGAASAPQQPAFDVPTSRAPPLA
ncbi:MAG: hypothetical protein HYR51_05090 [Candidatus Rokubacteria bacterium]|nr:hypothetical protein [Candidatus Rokubacteria bacterium]